jgi:TM2 domain-containing membrane protein YozV
VDVIPEDLRPGFITYRKAFYKKPFLAAALSTAVPGLGQLYIGKKRSFITTLMMNLTCGLQAYEACYKLGVKNPYSIFSLGFFGLFYLSNIYGSYSDTKVVKKEKRNQLFIDAAHYYNINYTGKLYQ